VFAHHRSRAARCQWTRCQYPPTVPDMVGLTLLLPTFRLPCRRSNRLGASYQSSVTSTSDSSPSVAEKRTFGMLSFRTVDEDVRAAYRLLAGQAPVTNLPHELGTSYMEVGSIYVRSWRTALSTGYPQHVEVDIY